MLRIENPRGSVPQETRDSDHPLKPSAKYDIVVLDPAFMLKSTAATNQIVQPTSDDEFASSPHFVKAMIQLVDSAEAYAASQPLFVAAQDQTMSAQQENNETKLLFRIAQLELEKEVQGRTDSEQELINYLHYSKHLKRQIILNRSKVRIARLLNHVTPTGTIMSGRLFALLVTFLYKNCISLNCRHRSYCSLMGSILRGVRSGGRAS